MKTIDDINLYTWFIERELDFAPEHFVEAKTPVTSESRLWIIEKLIGRYSFQGNTSAFFNGATPAFEDPKEALFYELTWS